MDREGRRTTWKLARMGTQPDTGLAWRAGTRFASPPAEPIVCQLGPGGPDLPDAWLAEKIPLMSARLVTALRDAGVDSLDCYPAQVLNQNGTPVEREYVAVNIVDLVRGTNRTLPTVHGKPMPGMLNFDRIELIPEQVAGHRLFRLYENVSFIVITEDVRGVIDAGNWVDVRAIALDDRAAY